MDGIFVLLIIFGIVNSVIKWAKKQQSASGQGRGGTPEKPWQRMMGDLSKTIEGSMSGKQPATTAPQTFKPKPAPPAVFREGTGGREGSALPGSILTPQVPYISSEGVSGLYAVGSDAALKAKEEADAWHGSTPGATQPATITHRMQEMRYVPQQVQAEQTATSTFDFQFNRSTLIQAVVMHEILTRPQDRRRRWSSH